MPFARTHIHTLFSPEWEDALCPNGSETILLSRCHSEIAEDGSLQRNLFLISLPVDKTGEIGDRACLRLIIGPCNLILVPRLRELPYNQRVIGFEDRMLKGEQVRVRLVPPVSQQ